MLKHHEEKCTNNETFSWNEGLWNEGLANETLVNTTEPDKVHVLYPTQTGIAPRSRNKTYG